MPPPACMRWPCGGRLTPFSPPHLPYRISFRPLRGLKRRDIPRTKSSLIVDSTVARPGALSKRRLETRRCAHRTGMFQYIWKGVGTKVPMFAGRSERLFWAGRQRTGPEKFPLLMVSAASPALSSGWSSLLSNKIFIAGFWAWLLAQFLKIFTKWFKTGVFNLNAILASGGMPSSHSALCSSVTTSVAIYEGLSSPLFAVAVCFSVIVMYDAAGVRRHAGYQAEVLNTILSEYPEGHPLLKKDELKEVLGHTPRQVMVGLLLGVCLGLLLSYLG